MAKRTALSSSQSHSTPSSSARPVKRTRLSSPPPAAAPSYSLPPEPSTLISATPSQPHSPSPSSSSAAFPRTQLKIDLPPPTKRTRFPGNLRRLSSGHPSKSRSSTASTSSGVVRPKQTLSGSKVGGKSKDLRDGADREEIWVKRSKGGHAGAQGMGFAGYLKRGVSAFVDRGCTSLSINGMGAAIPLCLSLALAIRDAIPGGEPAALPGGDEAEGAAGGEGEVVMMEVRTGSKFVRDEITPDDEDEDIVYQSRTKSTVEVELRIAQPLASSLGQPGKKRGAGGGGRKGSSRERKRRGGGAR
ncbi:hypothetical protein JCM8547_003262 [Rhodosporidiobolus lusitaniae]